MTDYDDITDARCESYWDNIEMPKEPTMEKTKIEAFLYTADNNTRISVSEWDDDKAWVSMLGNNGTMWVTLSRDEVEQLVSVFQAIFKS
jgi:hypothetical protein